MKTLFAILLMILPMVEIWIDSFDYKKGRKNKHALTALIRWVIMGGLIYMATFLIPLPIWRTIPLTIFFHLTFFGPCYNKIVLKQPIGYLSKDVFWDRIEIWIGSKITSWGLIGVKLILLFLSIAIYIYGTPYENSWTSPY